MSIIPKTTRFVRETPQHPTALLLAKLIGCHIDVASHLLVRSDQSLRSMSAWPVARFEQLGIGPKKAEKVALLIELAKRYACERVNENAAMRGPRDVAAVFAPKMQDLPVEEFHVAVLDAQHRLVRDILITRGILNSSLVHPREVFREAIAERAAAIILVHNHPSGDPTPSPEDRAVTEQLVTAGRLLDIPVHDHIIVGGGRYVSFCEAGLL